MLLLLLLLLLLLFTATVGAAAAVAAAAAAEMSRWVACRSMASRRLLTADAVLHVGKLRGLLLALVQLALCCLQAVHCKDLYRSTLPCACVPFRQLLEHRSIH
jgi:hypothetical protein